MLCLALCAVASAASMAEDALSGSIIEQPGPRLERELDRLDRQGAVDPLTRRRLADELRQAPEGPERREGERRLERLRDEGAATERSSPPLRPVLPPADLPSSLPSERRLP